MRILKTLYVVLLATALACGQGVTAVRNGGTGQDKTIYTDTGAANAYAVALNPAVSSYALGLCASFKAAHSNTGASTLAVNGLATKAIKKLDGATALASADVVAGQVVRVCYDGTNFQLQTPVANVATGLVSSFNTRTGDIVPQTGDYTPTNVGLGSVTNDVQTKAAVMPNSVPSAGQIPAGNAGGTAYAPVSMSQDCTMTSAGVVTCLKSNNVNFGTGAFATIANYVLTSVTVAGHALTSNVTVSASDVGLGSLTNDAQTKAAIVPNTAPSAGQVLAGNAGGTAYAPVTVGGDATMSSAGAVAVTKINGTTPGGTCTNQVATSISSSGVPTCSTVTSAMVNTSIAATGTDINTSNQVTATHLAAALPANQGGTSVTGTVHGNGTHVQLSDATGTSGNVTKFDANGNVVDGGVAASAIGSVTSVSAPGDFAVATSTTTPAISRTSECFNAGGTSGCTAITATPTFNCKSQEIISLTTTITSSTFSTTNCTSVGQEVVFAITSDGTHTIAWPSNVKGAAVPTITSTVITFQRFRWDGTNLNAVGAAVDSNGAIIGGGTTPTIDGVLATAPAAPVSGTVRQMWETTNGIGSIDSSSNKKYFFTPFTCINQVASAGAATGTFTCHTIVGGDMAANTVTSTQLAVVNTRKVCDIVIGDTSGSAITDAQLGPQKSLCFIPFAATVVEIDVMADGGTPNIIVGVDHAGSVSNLTSSALATASSGARACSKTTAVTGIDGATTCSATLQNTSVAAGDYIKAVSGTAGGVAKLETVHVVMVID